MKFTAPAKVNLCLHVTGRRPDGYHDLCMVMQKISLCDELDVEVTAKPGLSFSCPDTDLGNPVDNLVVKAAHALLKYDNNKRGLQIELKKNIPVAAGLGGGSSDAATTIIAINKLFGLNLPQEVLHQEALALGADVPFFLYSSVAWATGVGDRLQPISILPEYWLVLVNPGIGVSTAAVYGSLEAENYSVCPIVPTVNNADELVRLLHNDLETVTLNMCPQVAQFKDEMLALGASGVLMSGSGPTVFGVFFAEDAALVAQQKLLRNSMGWSCVVKPL